MDESKSSKGLAGLSTMITDVKAIEKRAQEHSSNTLQNARNENDKQTAQPPANEMHSESSQRKQEGDANKQQTNRYGCLAVLFFFLLLIFVMVMGSERSSNSTKTQQTRTITTNSSAATSKPQNSSPKKTNGTPSPKKNVVTGYDDNHPYLNDNGLCEITIDNTKNDMPVYVRIWDMKKHKPVRAFYIRQGGTFTADKLTPGRYEIRYRELYENGVPSHGTKSQIYTMEQHRTPTGTQYDTLSLTLYKVRNGNARTERIDANGV